MIKFDKYPKFLLRANLNKLARELRFLGYDAAVYKEAGWNNLKRLARREGRVILTRSISESREKNDVTVLLISSGLRDEQLSQLTGIIDFRKEYLFSRCPVCNKLLYEIDKNKIINSIPEYVYQRHENFKICRFCGHIFWHGDHYQAIYQRLKKLFREG